MVTEACGVLVENQNAEKLTQAVRHLLSCPKEDYSVECVENVARNFEKYVQIDKYLSLYQKMADRDK